MTTTTDMPNKVHHGRNIKRFREMLGMKQETLASELGDDWSQKKVSLLEAKEEVEPVLLDQVAKVFKVPVEAIKNLDEEGPINIIATTFNSHDYSFSSKCTFNINPVEKWIEALEENKKLYERLLQSEREKVELLQKILDRR